MKPLHRFFLTITCIVLASCQTAVPQMDSKLPRFSDKAVIRLNAASIDVLEEYTSSAKPPYIEHMFNYSPSEVFKSWVNDRLKSTGKSRRIEITILDASVKETDLQKTPGIKGLFTNDQGARYDANMQVQMRIYEEGKAIAVAEAEATAGVSRTLAENASLVERDQFFDRLTLEMVNKTTFELEKNMRRYFAPYMF